jgi:fructokinase
VVEPSLEKSELVKLNDEELERLAGWFDIAGDYEESIRGLADRFDCRTICVTRGSDGATLFHDGNFYEHNGYDVTTVDAVGAGDAFLAGLLTKLLDEDASPAQALEYANLLGACVVTRSGATPSIDEEDVRRVRGASAP